MSFTYSGKINRFDDCKEYTYNLDLIIECSFLKYNNDNNDDDNNDDESSADETMA